MGQSKSEGSNEHNLVDKYFGGPITTFMGEETFLTLMHQ